jgi:hypothetical protein
VHCSRRCGGGEIVAVSADKEQNVRLVICWRSSVVLILLSLFERKELHFAKYHLTRHFWSKQWSLWWKVGEFVHSHNLLG